MKLTPLTILPPLIFLGLAALLTYGMLRDNPDQLPSAQVGRPAPVIEALEPLGSRVVLEDALLREGGVKVVNFWASWCAPCRAEHPQLKTLAQTVPVYGVNYKDRAPAAEGFLRELGDPFAAIGADTTGRMGIDWGLYGVPETFILNAKGEVAFRFAGPITVEVLETIIMPEIEKAAGQ